MKKYVPVLALTLSCTAVLVLTLGFFWEERGEILIEEESEAHNEEKVRLTFFGYKADALNLITIERALRGFMDEYPYITITYESVKGKRYWDALERRAETGNMDDVVTIEHDRVQTMAAKGQLADLSGLQSIRNFKPWVREQFTETDGSVRFLPTLIATYAMYVNYDLLKAHGRSVPVNLGQFTEVCDYFVGKGIVPIIVNNYLSMRNLILARGLYRVYQSEDPAAELRKFNTGEASLAAALRPGIDLSAMMIRRGWIDCEEALRTRQTSDDLKLFAKGERPFMITGGWASPRVAALNPGFAYGVHAFPILEEGSLVSINLGTIISVNAHSPHLEDAKKFVEYLTRPNVIGAYCDNQSSFTPLNDERVPSDPTVAPVAKYLTTGPYVIETDYRLTLPLDAPLVECGTSLLKGMDAEHAAALLEKLLAQ